MARRCYIAYTAERGRPAPTPREVFRLLGLKPAARPDLWQLLQHIVEHTGNWMIVSRPADLGSTPLELALVLRLCAAARLSLQFVTPSIQVLVATPDPSERRYCTTADFADLARDILGATERRPGHR
jgi:hypothetical protein